MAAASAILGTEKGTDYLREVLLGFQSFGESLPELLTSLLKSGASSVCNPPVEKKGTQVTQKPECFWKGDICLFEGEQERNFQKARPGRSFPSLRLPTKEQPALFAWLARHTMCEAAGFSQSE